MNIEQPLDGMTWGDLRAFVALGTSLPDDAKVDIAIDQEDFQPYALAIWAMDARQIVTKEAT